MASNFGVYQLVKKDDTWAKRKVNGNKKQEACPCTIQEFQLNKDSWSWIVSSTIDFTYRIETVNGILNPSCKKMLISPSSIIGIDHNSYLPPNGLIKKPKRLVFIDKNVFELYHDHIFDYFSENKVNARLVPIDATEETKNMQTMTYILKEIDAFGLDRRDEPIIAMGGGVLMDIVGLASTLYRRRTPYIRVPTTLLGLVDASVGAKTGVNFCNGKNKLGAYVPPFAVFLDASFLRTLPRRHISNGLGEILKMALVKSKKLFERLENFGKLLIQTKFQNANGAEVVNLAIELMLEELIPNLWEDDLDRLVDFGHVISPTLEMEALPALFHGEAVNIDMSFMCVLSHVMGDLTQESLEAIIDCMRGLELPIYHPKCTLNLINDAFSSRKKHSNGKLRLPMPFNIGRARILNEVTPQQIAEAWKIWKGFCGSDYEVHTDSDDGFEDKKTKDEDYSD